MDERAEERGQGAASVSVERPPDANRLTRKLANLPAEWLLLGLFSVVSGLILVLIVVAELLMGQSGKLDAVVMLALRETAAPHGPLGPSWAVDAVRDLTALGSGLVLFAATSLIALLLCVARRGRLACVVFFAIASGALLNHLLKVAVGRPRPELVPHETVVHSLSFPSGHAMLSASFYLLLGVLFARTQARRAARALILSCAILLPMLIGTSRVYLGVHWPSDVLAGWSAGAAWALVWLLAAGPKGEHRTP